MAKKPNKPNKPHMDYNQIMENRMELLNETLVDPNDFTGDEDLQHDGIYMMAFTVKYPVQGPSAKGRKTSGGALFPHFGSFKVTAIKRAGEWKTIAYGPELNLNYSGENVTGLFVRITNDFGDNFATRIWDLCEEVDAEADSENVWFQVWLKVRIPGERGAIVRQEYRQGVQYAHRVMLIGEPVVVTDRNKWVITDDEGLGFNADKYLEGLAVKDTKIVNITSQNVGQMAVKSRALRKAQEAAKAPQTRQAATRSAQDLVSKRPTAGGTQFDFKAQPGIIQEPELPNLGEDNE